MNGKKIENYNIQECYDELKQLENPNLPPIQSMYHDMALDVITNRKQRIKKRLSQFDQAISELSAIKQRAEEMRTKILPNGTHKIWAMNNLIDYIIKGDDLR